VIRRPCRRSPRREFVSADGGRTFSPNSKIKDGICECCRLAMAWDGGTPLLLWRDILDGGIRDHSIARLEVSGLPAPRRGTDDGWRIDGCPHHGPALAVGPDRTWHLAWFTGEGKRGAGTFYRRSTDQGRSFSEPIHIGSTVAGRPSLATAGKTVWLAVGRTADTFLSWFHGRGGLSVDSAALRFSPARGLRESSLGTLRKTALHPVAQVTAPQCIGVPDQLHRASMAPALPVGLWCFDARLHQEAK
jgi:hypothetical protein